MNDNEPGRNEVAMSLSQIDPATLQAYIETNYRVAGEAPFVLQLGVHSPQLAALHAQHGVESSAYVTACNPLSEQLTKDENAAHMATLTLEVLLARFPHLPGEGVHPSGTWPAEPSLLVLGIDLAAARALGARYRQNAIVFCGADAVPRLELLR